MNVRNITTIIAALLSTVMFFSCEENSEEFLKRNLEELHFEYTESTLEFTVRATGQWSVAIPAEYSWIKADPASGTGNPDEYQKIRITCERNVGDVREGSIFLNGSGQSDVEIRIFQRDGLFEWTTVPNGARMDIDGLLQLENASTAYIRIPYLKATGEESFSMSASLSGKGAEGLSIDQSEVAIVDEGDGFIAIPITGTPARQGVVNVQVTLDNEDLGTVSALARVGSTILTKSFDEFKYGGDCIGNRAGITSINATADISLSDETKECAIGDNGANGSGVTSTIRGNNVSFYEEIKMTGWLGLRNYMRPGYIQLGAASATAKEYGSLLTPGLDIPDGVTVDIQVTFRGATYNDPSPDRIMLGLYPKGVQGINLSNIQNVTQREYVPFEIGHQKWVEFSVIIQNATNESALAISLPEEWVQSDAVQAARYYIDDIVVSY
ncbi:MAG: BACON domain-containing protein [Proteiniphilum sp.]|nr:BACON domain-containing protein [Proteiniphilum sp.]